MAVCAIKARHAYVFVGLDMIMALICQVTFNHLDLGVTLQACNEEHPAAVQNVKPLKVHVCPIHDHDRALREVEFPGNSQGVRLAIGHVDEGG